MDSINPKVPSSIAFFAITITYSQDEQIVKYTDKSHPFNLAYKAIRNNNEVELKKILNENPGILNMQEDEFEKTLLHQAVLFKNKKCISLLLDHKADINIKNKLGNSPFRDAFTDYCVSKKNNAQNADRYFVIVDLFAQCLKKKTVQDILERKNDFKKRWSF